MIASFARMLRIDPGFAPEHVLTASISLPVTRYEEADARARFTALLLEQARALPGVTSAAVTNVIPYGDDFNSSVVTPEGYVATPGEALVSPLNSIVSDDYFETMGIDVTSGRSFTASDVTGAPAVAIIDRELADHFFPGQDPVGRRITQGAPGLGRDEELLYRTIVGVVDEVQVGTRAEDQPPGHYYTPFAQDPVGRVYVVLRSTGTPTAVVRALRGVVAALDPDLPLYQVQTMEERMSASLSTERARTMLLGSFAAIALFLAAIGLYGVLAYSVAQRSAEIGIRMALGSTTRNVFAMVLRQGGVLIAWGLIIGLAGSFILARLVRSMLYDVAPTEPVVYAGVLVLLILTAVVACVVPARRAARVDPLVAIRATT
jgi:putative ABC transport system permease protein